MPISSSRSQVAEPVLIVPRSDWAKARLGIQIRSSASKWSCFQPELSLGIGLRLTQAIAFTKKRRSSPRWAAFPKYSLAI